MKSFFFRKKLILFALLICVKFLLTAQLPFNWENNFTRADTLRGEMRLQRACYDVTFYDLTVKVDIDKQFITGACQIDFKVLTKTEAIQIDLFRNMEIVGIDHEGKKVNFIRDEDAVFVTLPLLQQGSSSSITVFYKGTPRAAQNAPWDGGFVWKKDKNDKAWVGVACEGLGASSWWPCKDHLSDEPDSMSIRVIAPSDLFCVANGNLRKKEILDDGNTRFDWFVSYPINTYNVTLNIADYVRLSDIYTSKIDNTSLDLEFYCLSYNYEKAKKQFQQVKPMLEAYEHYFDKYPFWRDGYCLVETSYLGMEHQGAIAYGNQYKRGYLGGMIPKDMNWDYIIIHETGHEYWGNSISCNDHAEMWIHESFTTYMEALYVEYTMSYPDAMRYLDSQRENIYNVHPLVGPLGVNFDNWSGSDMYYKGAWMLHTLRHSIGDDKLFFGLLKSFYKKNKISNINTSDFTKYVSDYTKVNYAPFFNQYLYCNALPTLEYDLKQKGKDLLVSYRWKADVAAFDMPILVGSAANYEKIKPTTRKWQTTKFKAAKAKDFNVATQFFLVNTEKVNRKKSGE